MPYAQVSSFIAAKLYGIGRAPKFVWMNTAGAGIAIGVAIGAGVGIAIGAAVSAAVAVIVVIWEWVENPGGIFH